MWSGDTLTGALLQCGILGAATALCTVCGPLEHRGHGGAVHPCSTCGTSLWAGFLGTHSCEYFRPEPVWCCLITVIGFY